MRRAASKHHRPAAASGKNGYLSGTELTMESLLRLLRREHRIFAGNVGNDASTLAQSLGLTITDYFASEELSVRNAIPTAEGAIEAAMKHTSVTLHGTPCLVLGFGRIGKVLAHDLSALGAKVSVSARKRSDLAWIDAFGYAPLHTNRLSGTLGNSAWCSTPCRIRYWTKRSLPNCRRTACSSSLRARAALTWTRSKRCAFRISRQGDCPGASRRRRRRAPSKRRYVDSSRRKHEDRICLCGSFCNHPELLKLYEDIAREHEIVPILSENAAKYSTRFGTAEDFVTRVEVLAGRKAVRNIVEAEPLGPQGAMEVLVIAPCTGNTLAKLAHGITDGAVTMAAKGHLRNGKPVVLAIATNDGLSASAPNIAVLLNRKNYYFVPFGQDNAEAKPTSLIADFRKIIPTAEAALEGRQIQPILL
ncbi:MAG: dipicolinate synthase subunit B [Oscillibacter sp.]